MFWLRLKLRKCALWNTVFAARVLATETIEGEFMAPAVVSRCSAGGGGNCGGEEAPGRLGSACVSARGSRVCALPFGKLSPWNRGREGFSGNQRRAFPFEREDMRGGFASGRRGVLGRLSSTVVNDLKGKGEGSSDRALIIIIIIIREVRLLVSFHLNT